MKIREIATVSEVVDVIGRERVMEITGRNTNHVTNWIIENRFPAKTFLIFEAELKRLRKRASAKLWGMEKAAA